MVQIDLGDFTINVPLKHRMDVREFLAIADRLAKMHGKPRTDELPRPTPPPAADTPAEEAREEDFYLDKEHELEHLLTELREQNKRVEQHDEVIAQILEYLHSVAEHMKRR